MFWILDHWEMRSIRNNIMGLLGVGEILDHWEMRSIRNLSRHINRQRQILDHWEMRSIRNNIVKSIKRTIN